MNIKCYLGKDEYLGNPIELYFIIIDNDKLYSYIKSDSKGVFKDAALYHGRLSQPDSFYTYSFNKMLALKLIEELKIIPEDVLNIINKEL